MSSVLWVTAMPPDHRNGGGHIRQAYLIDALAERARIHLVAVGRVDDDRVRSTVTTLTEVRVPPSRPQLPRGPRRSLRHLRDAVFERYPAEVAAHAEIRRVLRPIVEARQTEVDIVCLEFAGLAPLLPRRRTVPFSITFHNLLSGMAEQAVSITPGRRQRWYQQLEQRKARRLERWATAAYDQVIVASPEDARALAANVAVVPNGVDTSYFAPTPVPESQHVVVTGALYTLPNIDGATWFCEHVLPLVRRRHPDVTFDIVGHQPLPSVLALDRLPGVQVHADVPSVLPYLARARVAVAPLRIGTGTRLKALEAMAAGRPVVGTTVGLDGLELVDGKHALFADSPDHFADAISRVLEDDGLANRLAETGRRHVEERYAWDAIGPRFASLLLDGVRPS